MGVKKERHLSMALLVCRAVSLPYDIWLSCGGAGGQQFSCKLRTIRQPVGPRGAVGQQIGVLAGAAEDIVAGHIHGQPLPIHIDLVPTVIRGGYNDTWNIRRLTEKGEGQAGCEA